MNKLQPKIKFTLALIQAGCTRAGKKLMDIISQNKILFIRNKKKYLLTLTLIGVILLGLLKFGSKLLSTSTLSEGMVGLFNQQDLPLIVTNLISLPLVKLDKSALPQPVLAQDWQVNNNATVYTFKLKDNLYWNDGTKLKSSDIKFNLIDVTVAYPDEKTIEFRLADSFSPFPTLLTQPVFKGDTLIGIGKYKVIDKNLTQRLITKLVLQSEDKNYPKIYIRFYPDEKTLKTAFEIGEVDTLLGVSDEGEFASNPFIKLKQFDLFNKLVAIFYNTKDPILSDKNLRIGLSLATLKPEDKILAKTPVPPTSWAFNKDTKQLIGSQQLAESYLKKVKNGKDKQLVLTTTPALASLAQNIAQAWKDLDLKVVVRIESGIPQNFQALLISQPIPADPDQYILWHSTQEKTNLTKYSSECCPSSARVDKDLEDGRRITDLQIRKEKYFDFQKIIVDDAPATFLYFPRFNVVYRKKAGDLLNKVLDLQIPM